MILFTHLFTLLAISHFAKAQKVALGINTLANKNDEKVPSSAGSFIELISKGVFVDKTLLINDILSNTSGIPVLAPSYSTYRSVIALTAPSKWGKTTNLDMLKTFLQIQVHPNGSRILPVSGTPNYQLFTKGEYYTDNNRVKLQNPPLISNAEYKTVVDEYLGQYPVIRISFADPPSKPGMTGLQVLAELISRAYREHSYLLGVYERELQRPNLTEKDTEVWGYCKYKFSLYLNCQITHEYDFQYSLDFLSQELHDHFGVKVYILIDQYYRYLGSYYDIMTVMLWIIIEDNDYVKQIIIAGVLPIEINVRVLHMQLTYTPFFNYTGFTGDEMELIYRHYQIPEQDRAQLKRWYGGYQTLDDPRDEIFNPWSILNYLKYRQLRPYWADSNNTDARLQAILKSAQLRNVLDHLVSGKDYETEFKPPKFLAEYSNSSDEIPDKESALRYLFGNGFLTVKNSFVNGSQQISKIHGYRIPNYEITTFLKNNFQLGLTSA